MPDCSIPLADVRWPIMAHAGRAPAPCPRRVEIVDACLIAAISLTVQLLVRLFVIARPFAKHPDRL